MVALRRALQLSDVLRRSSCDAMARHSTLGNDAPTGPHEMSYEGPREASGIGWGPREASPTATQRRWAHKPRR
eukprot:2850013-Pyramimonas_sp.AAC.1